MTVTAAEAALAVTATVECWGGHRRTPPGLDQYGKEGMLGCVLELLGLHPLVPVADRALHAPFAGLVAQTPVLGERLTDAAVQVLDAVGSREHSGASWAACARTGRSVAADLAVAAEVAGTEPVPDVDAVLPGPDVPPGVQVVRVQRPRTDGLTACPSFSPAVMLLGGTAVAFGCGRPEDHPADGGHRWNMAW